MADGSNTDEPPPVCPEVEPVSGSMTITFDGAAPAIGVVSPGTTGPADFVASCLVTASDDVTSTLACDLGGDAPVEVAITMSTEPELSRPTSGSTVELEYVYDEPYPCDLDCDGSERLIASHGFAIRDEAGALSLAVTAGWDPVPTGGLVWGNTSNVGCDWSDGPPCTAPRRLGVDLSLDDETIRLVESTAMPLGPALTAIGAQVRIISNPYECDSDTYGTLSVIVMIGHAV